MYLPSPAGAASDRESMAADEKDLTYSLASVLLNPSLCSQEISRYLEVNLLASCLILNLGLENDVQPATSSSLLWIDGSLRVSSRDDFINWRLHVRFVPESQIHRTARMQDLKQLTGSTGAMIVWHFSNVQARRRLYRVCI